MLAIGAFGSPTLANRVATDGPGCPFRIATGVPCPFCGMTHATLALGGGHWSAALAAHPLAPLVLAGVLGALAVIAIGRADLLTRGRRPLAILVAISAVWLIRLLA